MTGVTYAEKLARDWLDLYESPGGDPPVGPRYGTLGEQAEVARALLALVAAPTPEQQRGRVCRRDTVAHFEDAIYCTCEPPLRENCAADSLSRGSAEQTVEQYLRREWFVNHGCGYYALYGDDGEMMCANGRPFHLPLDFKRQPIEELREAVFKARLARGAVAGSAEQTEDTLREAKLDAIRGVCRLMNQSSLPFTEAEDDTIYPHSNGYGVWFVRKEQASGEGIGTAAITPEEILERIEARALKDPEAT